MKAESGTRRTPFSAQVFREDQLIIFRLIGDLDVTGSQTLKNHFASNVVESDRYIVFEMGGVPYINSAGLAALIGFLRNIQLRDGQLMLVNAQPKVKSVFQIASLESSMLFLDSIEDAHRVASGIRMPDPGIEPVTTEE